MPIARNFAVKTKQPKQVLPRQPLHKQNDHKTSQLYHRFFDAMNAHYDGWICVLPAAVRTFPAQANATSGPAQPNPIHGHILATATTTNNHKDPISSHVIFPKLPFASSFNN
jgi:hypothetical protein